MEWDTVWRAYEGHEEGSSASAIEQARQKLERPTRDDVAWCKGALVDVQRRRFVAAVLSASASIPEDLFDPAIRAAVHEVNSIASRLFVEPCARVFGEARVIRALLEYLEDGTTTEKSGAANALYWTKVPLSPEAPQHVKSEVAASRDEARAALLRAFVENDDVRIQRSVSTIVRLKKPSPSDPLFGLAERAYKAAKSHTDPFIRDRVD